MTFERGRFLFHNYLHIIALCGIGVGLTLNKVVLSVSVITAIANLVLYGKFRMYRENLKNTRYAWGAALYVALMLLSFLWSADWAMGFKEAKPKIVLLIIPLVFLAGPTLSASTVRAIRIAFVTSLLLTSVLNVMFYVHLLGDRTYNDFRDISLFGSHIRYSILIVMGIVNLVVLGKIKSRWRLIAVAVACWFAWYLWYSQALSGYIVAFAIGIALPGWYILRKPVGSGKVILVAAYLCVFAGGIAFARYLLRPHEHKVEWSALPSHNANGKLFYSDPKADIWVNGYPVYACIEPAELERSWNLRSAVDYQTGLNKKGHPVSGTILSYMTSLNLPKDSAGVSGLSDLDIRNIEQGIASVTYTGHGISPRIENLRDHINGNADPNGNTLLQRFEYWRAAVGIIREHWVTGVGFGDLRKTFEDYYVQHHSPLREEFRNISHNEFLFSWVSMGIFGIVVFVFWWVRFLRETVRRNLLEGFLFGTVFLTSCLFEDTLGTQVGANFCGFFFGFYAYLLQQRRPESVTV